MPTNNYSVIQEAQKKELSFLSQNLGGRTSFWFRRLNLMQIPSPCSYREYGTETKSMGRLKRHSKINTSF